LRIDECHGSIRRLQCLVPCSPSLWPASGLQPAVDEARCALRGPLPACRHCGAIAQPNILMFDDGGWIEERRAQQAGAAATRWKGYAVRWCSRSAPD